MSSFFGRFFNSSTMKRIVTSLLAALCCIALFAADLNPFAYNLYTSTNADGGTRLHFSINAFAPTVEVYIVVGSAEKKIRTYSNVAKNNYSTDLTASDAASAGLTAGSSYSWKVKVTTPDRSSAAEYVGRKVSDKPIFSIDIDNNPASPYFSRILATHGTDNIANAQGIYAYNAAFEADGGRNMGTGVSTYANWWSGNHLTPYRIRIAQDGSGRIFLGNYDLSHTGAYLWQVDPAKLTSWTQLIARTWMKSNVGTNVDDIKNTLDVYNMGLDIRTNGNKYELLLLSANTGGANFTTGSVFSGVYTIPDITKPTTNCTYKQLKWTKVTGEQSVRNLFGSALNGSAIYDKHGGVWYCGNSSYGTQLTYPGLAHQFATATDYKINYDNSDAHFQKQYTSAGGIRYDKNHARMVVAQGMNRTNIVGCIYTVTQASAGTRPTLGSRVDLNAGSAKGSTSWYVTDFAWDYADNIYACVRNTSADVRGVYAFATDLGGAVLEVPARSNFTLKLPAAGVVGNTGLNPYAYNVSATYDDATYKLTVKFSLNADAYNDGLGGNADGVQIFLTDDPANPKKYYVHGVPGNQCFKGKDKTCTIDLISGKDKNGLELPRNTNLYASVTVQGDRTNTSPRQDSRSYKIYCGHGIAVDKNPNSKNFGKIFVNEGYQKEAGGELSQFFTKGLAGMYIIDPDFDRNNDKNRYTGGYDFSLYTIEHTYSGLKRLGYQPWRVRVSEDGRIFVCSNDMYQRQADNNGVAVWEIDRNNFNNWTPILRGVRGGDYTFTYQGNFIGPICGMDVKGIGDNLTLLLYTVNKTGVDLGMSGFRAYEYNVKSGKLTPVTAFNSGKYGLVFEYTTLRYGVDGSYWFGASRADGSDGVENNGKTKEPNLGHVKLDGTSADYTNYNAEFYGGAGLLVYKSTYNNSGYNASNHTWLIKGRSNTATDGKFGVFLVTSDNNGGAQVARLDGTNGRPNWQEVVVNGIGRNLNDFAIDYAENLYVIGNSSSSGGLVRAFAMPYCGEKTTTVRDEYKFQLKGQAITWHPYHCPETMINEDLWELFMEDYNEYYKTILPKACAVQPITNAIGFTYPPEEIRGTYPNGVVLSFLQNHPQWKWLHDYINTVVNNEATTPTSNEALWAAFKTAANITSLGTLAEISVKGEGQPHDVSATPCACRIIAGQLTNDKMRTIYENNSWKWLFDYIKTIQTGLSTDLTKDENAQAWRYAVAAFFLQSKHETYPVSSDFSTAGLPTAWGPKAGKTYAFSLTGELTWRLHVHAFFNKTNSVTYNTNDGGTKTDATADFSEAGDPHAWYNTWAEVTFPKVLRTGDKMPKIKRKGYIFAGWHYGTEQGFTRGQKMTDNQYNENVTNNKHIWARWMELCLYEGYNKPDPHFLGEPEKVNYNAELMNMGAGASHYVDIQRNIAPSEYNTLTLPFAIPKNHMDFFKKVTDEDGAYVFDPEKGGVEPSILVFDGVQEVEENGETVVEFRFHELQDNEEILANTPFLFKTNNPEKLSARLHFWSAYFSSAQTAAVLPGQVSFVPVLEPQMMTIPNGTTALILVSDNRLAKVTAPGEMLGLRGYFVAPSTLSNMPARITVKEPVASDTENVETSEHDSVYKILENQRVYIIRDSSKFDILGNLVK